MKKELAVTLAKRMNYVPLYIVASCLVIQGSGDFDESRITDYVVGGYRAVANELEQDLFELLRFLSKLDKPRTAAEIETAYGEKRTSVYLRLRLLTYFRLIEKSSEKPAKYSLLDDVRGAFLD